MATRCRSSRAIAATRRAASTKQQIGRIRDSVAQLRQLDERKQTILRSIESQNKLTDELRREIERGRQREAARRFVSALSAEEANARHEGPRAGPRAAGRGNPRRRTRRPPISTPGRPTSSTPTKACPTRRRRCWAPGTFWPSSSANDADLRQKVRKLYRKTRQAGQRQDRRQREEESAVSRLPRLPRAAAPHSAASRAGDQSRRAGQGAPRARSKPTSRRSSSSRIELLVPPEHPHKDFLTGCVRDALARLDAAEPGARSAPRAHRKGRDARRRGVRPQLAEPAAAAAAPRQARAGGRSRLQERLQAGGAR